MVDNAIVELVGMGMLSNIEQVDLLIDLLTKDTADQSGDTLIGLLNSEKDWLLKLTNNPDGQRIYVKFYGEEQLKERLRSNYSPY